MSSHPLPVRGPIELRAEEIESAVQRASAKFEQVPAGETLILRLTRAADSLLERGLITRTASEQDRRRTTLRITPAGEALVAALLTLTGAVTRTIFADIPMSARQSLLEQLRRLSTQIDRVARSR